MSITIIIIIYIHYNYVHNNIIIDDNMEVEDEELLDAANDNDPALDATDDSSADDPVAPDNAAGNRL